MHVGFYTTFSLAPFVPYISPVHSYILYSFEFVCLALFFASMKAVSTMLNVLIIQMMFIACYRPHPALVDAYARLVNNQGYTIDICYRVPNDF